MSEFSYISSLSSAEDACRKGILTKTLLLPPELGGRKITENVVYIPPYASDIKDAAVAELLSAVRKGMTEVAIVPTYHGASFVPTSIKITAAKSGMAPGYELDINIWRAV